MNALRFATCRRVDLSLTESLCAAMARSVLSTPGPLHFGAVVSAQLILIELGVSR